MKHIKLFEEFVNETNQMTFSSHEKTPGDIVEAGDVKVELVQVLKTNANNGVLKFSAKDAEGNEHIYVYDDGLDGYKQLDEKKIGDIEEKVPIRVEIDTTTHAEERKNRHGENMTITDSMIIKAVDLAMDAIGANRIKGTEKNGQKYWIYDAMNDLNVIGILALQQGELVFLVITVMIEKDFHGSPDTKKIVI